MPLRKFQEKVLAKTPGVYQVPKIRNATTTTAAATTRDFWGTCENPRSLSSSKAEKFEFDFFDGQREERWSDPLAADKS